MIARLTVQRGSLTEYPLAEKVRGGWRNDLTKVIESQFCPNSTDGGGKPEKHCVKDGGCVICDRSLRALADLHGGFWGRG